jgi:hypothetical protein
MFSAHHGFHPWQRSFLPYGKKLEVALCSYLVDAFETKLRGVVAL